MGKKLLKFLVYFTGFLVILAVAGHLWFMYRAKDLLENMVEKRSGGKLTLTIDRLRYNYFTRNMTIRGASFFTSDTLRLNTEYRFTVPEIRVRLKALSPLLLEDKLFIDSMSLRSPDIRVTRLRYSENPVKEVKDVSIPYEMGEIYRSIQEVLQELEVKKFRISEGHFTLHNKAAPRQVPVKISDINLLIENLKVDPGVLSGEEKILFSDNISLHCSNQQILFPGGRHSLSFKGFRINLQNQLVEFDSCSIAGTKADSSDAAFSIFFDKLKMSNVDFDTLYRHEIIKADTVFCLNPRFLLHADISSKKDPAAGGPRLEKIIQQLTGDLFLSHVIVNNASFDITTVRDGVPNTFTSNENDFEMQGLSINKGSARPVQVMGFAMAIRHYENFIKDSSYRVQFDSVMFREDRISLNNFLFHKLDRGRIINTFRIPRFYLGGLSWDDLVFNRKLKAEQATLFNPVIDYTVSEKLRGSRSGRDIFQSLAEINDFVELEYLDIQNGDINLFVHDDFHFRMANATLSIQSRALLNSTELAGIKQSLTSLKFEKGNFHAGNYDITFLNTYYIGQNGRFSADRIDLAAAGNKTRVMVDKADIGSMTVDEKTGNIEADGISWNKGELYLDLDTGNRRDPDSWLLLKNIKGKETRIGIKRDQLSIGTLLTGISLASLEKKPGEPIQVRELETNGSHFDILQPSARFSTGPYQFKDRQGSHFKQAVYQNSKPGKEIHITAPDIRFIPDLASLLEGSFRLGDLILDQPEIHLDFTGQNRDSLKTGHTPRISIDRVRLRQPAIRFRTRQEDDTITATWPRGKNNTDYLLLEEVRVNEHPDSGSSVKQVDFHISGPVIEKTGGWIWQAPGGELSGQIAPLRFSNTPGTTARWMANIMLVRGKKLEWQQPGGGKGKLFMESFTLEQARFSPSYFTRPARLASANAGLRVSGFTGYYEDSASYTAWHNASIDKKQKLITADSVIYLPRVSRDSFFARRAYQADYIRFRTGAIRVQDIDLDSYLDDDLLKIKKLQVDNVLFDDYRDKRLPRKTADIKLLPAGLVKKIPWLTRIDTISITSSTAFYTELNDKTNLAGMIPITRLQVRAYPVKNFDWLPGDSLTVEAEGRIMDSVKTSLMMRQSYEDPAGGFILLANMKSSNLPVMNPVLEPLASARLLSGWLDSLRMTVTGNDRSASGKMYMRYRDLKIRVLKPDQNGTLVPAGGFKNFIVNTFFINNKNRSKPADIFYTRARDRSVLHYIVKTFMSGVTTGTGMKSSRKLRKELKQALKNPDKTP